MVKDAEFSMGRRWVMFSIVFLVGILSAFAMFKAPPLFTTEFTTDLGFTEKTMGWVMSIFAMVCVILAFPAGGILAKLGIKKSLMITAASLVLGAGLGAIATSANFMLVTRFIEGVGMGLISVVGPAAVASIIPERKQGLAMGIWSVWFPAGVVLAFNISPLLYNMTSAWQSAWWFTAIFSLIAFLLITFVYADPPREATGNADTPGALTALKPDMKSIFLLAIAFGCWNIVNAGAISGFYPAFLADVHNLDTQTAGSISSVTNIVVLFVGPITGILADKFKLRKGLLLFGFFGAAALMTIAFGNSLPLIWLFVVLMGFFSASAATGTFASAPILARNPEKVGTAMAIISFFQNIGILVGSAAFGVLAVNLGWNMASLTFNLPIFALGGILILFMTNPKKYLS